MTRISRSVVIPMYRERERLPATLVLLAGSPLDQPGTELILVDDGSDDGTADVAEHGCQHHGLRATVLRRPAHLGKGAAVTAGILATRGASVAFVDADLSTGAEDVARCLRVIEEGSADVVAATRAHPDSTIDNPGPVHRQLSGRAYNRLLRLLRLTDLRDTQCGLKGFRAEAAHQIFASLSTVGFAFDVEVLARARRLGLRIEELPVRWTHVPASRVRPWRDAPSMSRDALRIWRAVRSVHPAPAALRRMVDLTGTAASRVDTPVEQPSTHRAAIR